MIEQAMRRITNTDEYNHALSWLGELEDTLQELRAKPIESPHKNQPYPERLRNRHIADLTDSIKILKDELARYEKSETAHHAWTGQ